MSPYTLWIDPGLSCYSWRTYAKLATGSFIYEDPPRAIAKIKPTGYRGFRDML